MPRKPWTRLPQSTWLQIRAAYESDPSQPTFIQLGKLYGVDKTTIGKRALADSWARKDSLALRTLAAVQDRSDAIVEQTAASVASQLTRNFADNLQPWIERQKTRHIRQQVQRSKRALKQLDQHIDPNTTLSPKDSSFVAKTAETWDTILRRNLGLQDGTAPAGSLNLQILTNHSAVQIKPSE